MSVWSSEYRSLVSLREPSSTPGRDQTRGSDCEPPRFAMGTLIDGINDDLAIDSDAVLVSDAMPASLVTLSGDAPVTDAREALCARGAYAAPVVDARDRAIGFVTLGELSRAVDGGHAKTVGDVMTCFAFGVRATATLGRAAALMAYEGIGYCVVNDGAGRVVGMISALDVARWVGECAGHGNVLGGPGC